MSSERLPVLVDRQSTLSSVSIDAPKSEKGSFASRFLSLKNRYAQNTQENTAQEIWDSHGVNRRLINPDGSLTKRGKIRKFTDTPFVSGMMTFCTLWALFALDFSVIFHYSFSDILVGVLLIFSIFVFSIEIIFETYVQGTHYFEFYLWLDLFSTLSLVPDVIYLFSEPGSRLRSAFRVLNIARAGRAARVSSRATRIIRFMKMLNANRLKKKVAVQDFDVEDGEAEEVQQSDTSARFAESTTRRVVFIILFVLVVVSLIETFSPSDYIDGDQTFSSMMDIFVASVDSDGFARFIGETAPQILIGFPDIDKIAIDDVVVVDRGISRKLVDIVMITGDRYSVTYNIRSFLVSSSIANISLALVIIGVLMAGNLLFIYKAERLVIGPVERMTHIVRQLVKNPLTQLKTHVMTAKGETGLILQMLAKLVGLVQTAFGEAGSAIIAANMSEGGKVDVMKPGVRIEAIYGFCDIRNFTDITEILNEDCIFLVNEIASILHGNIHARLGSANKNIGDAFLLTWKLFKKDDKKFNSVPFTASLALNAFLHTIRDMRISESLAMLQEKFPAYPIRMGYGLHCGWAIEGAIGSSYKIDASYLSPHVNLSSRLESLTKLYGVSILCSGAFYNLLPPNWRARLRHIDSVYVKGSMQEMDIYTVDDLTPVDDACVLEPPESYGSILRENIALHTAGFSAYRSGNWTEAKRLFDQFVQLTKDGPTMVLLGVMAQTNYKAPPNFRGVRALDEK